MFLYFVGYIFPASYWMGNKSFNRIDDNTFCWIYWYPSIYNHSFFLPKGHTRQGLRCRICKVNAHADCATQLPKCQVKAKLLRRQKSTSEIENRIEQEEESEYWPVDPLSAIFLTNPIKHFSKGMEWFSLNPMKHYSINWINWNSNWHFTKRNPEQL